MTHRTLPITREKLAQAFAAFEVFGFQSYLDAETGSVTEIADDVLDYCRGEGEGTDLQLSDSRELPTAQQIARELQWLEQGFDEEGLPFTPADQRFFPLPRLGELEEKERHEALLQWLEEHGLETAG
ncbi:MAG: hypothetical protein PWP23_2176 [Candidatus Sumerlaeota bacterium]|nr:hypothetical protein [Candidatus Sumerlaeota bacterium]